MIRAILLALALAIALAAPLRAEQVLRGKHFFHTPRLAAGVASFIRWHPLRGTWHYQQVPLPPEPPPATHDIYIRQFQAYSFGDGPHGFSPYWAAHASSGSPGWISVQLDAAATEDMIGIAYLPLGKGSYQTIRVFSPHSIRLPASGWLLLEFHAPAGSPFAGELPVIDVLWTEAP